VVKAQRPSKAEQAQFLGDMAQAMGCSVESLVAAGYDQSVQDYIANEKTPQQVASIVMSNARRAKPKTILAAGS